MNVLETMEAVIRMHNALILMEVSDVFAMQDFQETVTAARTLMNVPRTRHSVLTGSVVTTRAPSGASVRWASQLPAPGTRRTVLTLMSVRSSPTSVSTGPVRIRTGCSSVSVTRDTN